MNQRERPQTIAERRVQLERIADALLNSIEHGQYSTSERLKLLQSYNDIERTLESLRKQQKEEEVALLLRWSDLAIDRREE